MRARTGRAPAAKQVTRDDMTGGSGAAGSRRPVLALIAALLGAAAVALAAVTLAGSRSQVTVHPEEFLTGQGGPSALITATNSPSVARNPAHPDNLVAVDRVDRPGYSAGLHWSIDGARTWHDTALPLPPGRDRPYAPDAAFAADGTLYVTYVNLEGTGNDPQTLWISRSTDLGRTLSAPSQVTSRRYAFQARTAVDGKGTVYVSWVRADTVGLLTITSPVQVVMARSTDGGRTFSQPVAVSDPARARVGGSSPVVDSDGAVDVLYEDFGSDTRDFLDLEGPTWSGRFSLVVARSTDGGRSFAPGVVVDAGVVPTERFLVYLPVFPSIAAGPDRRLYVSWADGRSGGTEVYVRRSSDAGQTWSAPAEVSGVLGAGMSAWMPRVSVAPGGRVDVLYDGGHRAGLIDTYLSSSDDGAASFRTARLSTASFDARIGPLAGPSYLAPDLGSRLGLTSSDDGTVAVWTDTRQGTVDTGRQDIAAVIVDIPSGGFSALRLALILVLLAAAAGVMAALALATRRSATPAEPASP